MAFSVTVHAFGSGYAPYILNFCSTNGTRVIAITYSRGFLGIDNYGLDAGIRYNLYKIEMNKEYHIEIVQEMANEKVRICL